MASNEQTDPEASGNVSENSQLTAPTREILKPNQMETWEKSLAYKDILGFIKAMSESVKNIKITDKFHVSDTVLRMVGVLDTISCWIDDIPPIEQPQRFGNKAFKTWFSKLQNEAKGLVEGALDTQYHYAVPEIEVYLIESVGNSTRIDYGTGHELCFTAFLCCLFKISVFKEEDSTAVILKLFNRYLELMRKLQTTYRMEPAGSHGVWSLDDYQFLPFVWGSSQLLNHQKLLPKSFPDQEICSAFSKDYMFLKAIAFIHEVKTGPFAEHSNQLWNISGVSLWSKVNSGLLKMYKVEVLGKFPVIQHFLFGSLLPINPADK